MKKILLCSFYLLLFAWVDTYAKNKQDRVTIHLDNVPLKTLFSEISAQTQHIFFYNNDVLNDQQTVRVNSNNELLEVLLQKVLKPKGIGFKIQEDYILLFNTKDGADAQLVSLLRIKPSRQDSLQTFTGTILEENGSSIPGATIRNLNKNSTVISNQSGTFMIQAEEGDWIEISYLGYESLELKASANNLANITLIPSVSGLDEVLITGYTSQRKREITGAISSIDTEEIEGAMSTSIDGAMQGRMSGVNVQSQVGVPGGAIRVRVRGAGSISAGNDPIYVLDGVVVNTSATSNAVSTNPLATLNPEDILSIEVLKDAAAASVYGAQAANGVILVTTKKGRKGKTNIDFAYRRGYASPIQLMDVLSSQEYLNARIEAVRNFNPTWSETQVMENVLNTSQLPLDTDIASLPTYDWQDASYRTGASDKFTLSLDGGADKSQFRLSAGYEDTEGSIIGSDFKRGTLNLHYSHDLSARVNLASTVNLSTVKQNGPLGAMGTTTQFSAPSYASPMMLPFVPIYLDNGELNVDYAGFPGTFKRNIVHSTKYNEHSERTYGALLNLQLNYKISDQFNYRTVVGLDYRDSYARNFYDPRTSDGYNSKGSLTEYTNKPLNFTNTHVLTYSPILNGEHEMKVLAGVEYNSYANTSNQVRGQGFPTFQFQQMQSAALITDASGSWTGFRRLGSFVQANYTFAQRFMASGILRYDGSSRFGNDNRFGLFPAISVGWDMAGESFLEQNAWIDQLKLRVGYGHTGNDQIGNFASRSLYGGGVSYDGGSGIRANSLGNANLRWERNVTTNIGLDFAFLNQRLNGSVEVYNRLSKDLLLSRPVPWAGGFDEIVENLGEVKNQGLELEIGARIFDKSDFQWNSSFNISFQKNEVVRLYDGLSVLPGDESVRVGYSMLTHVYTQYAGVNPATGKAVWYDPNGNLSYSPPAMQGEYYAPYGLPNGMPTHFGGFNNTFTYKGFSLGVFFQYDYGRVVYNNMGRTLGRKGDSQINTMQWYYDNRWQHPGQLTTVPRPINNAAERGSARGDLASSRYLEDASYIRLKNVNLSYALPEHFSKRLGFRSASISLQANNLWTLTEFTGYDPEFVSANTGVIPTMKAFFLGIQVGL